jgi:hypothetical protein
MNLSVSYSNLVILVELVNIVRHLIPITLTLNPKAILNVKAQAFIGIGGATKTVRHYTITQNSNT